MKEFNILRFENRLISECSKTLEIALELVTCEMKVDVFLVGFNLETKRSVSIPANTDTDLTQALNNLDVRLSNATSNRVEYPIDAPYLTDSDWGNRFREYDDFLIQCWHCFYDTFVSESSEHPYLEYVSPCCEINNNILAVVASCNKIDHEAYPHLAPILIHQQGRWPSLHYGIVETVINKFASDISQTPPNSWRRFESEIAREVVQSAGDFFMGTHATCGKLCSSKSLWELINKGGAPNFYEACNSIAAMPYESREGIGTILVADRENKAVETVIDLETPFPVTDSRRARKLLETTHTDLSLLSDSREIWGIGIIDEEVYQPSDSNIMTVRFLGQSHWRLAHQKLDLMDVHFNKPKLPTPQFNQSEIKNKISETFPSLLSDEINKLAKITTFAIDAEHGTMLVISNEAAIMASKLSGNNRVIKPFTPTQETIKAVSAIDGSILIDLTGICHGIGIILDGLSCKYENPARGARYNSAIRYIKTNPQCLIVVVSEDKTVDIITHDLLGKL